MVELHLGMQLRVGLHPGQLVTVAGFVHAGSGDEVLKSVLAAIGFKAYEIGSYKVLLTLADAAGATADRAVLAEQSIA